MLQSHHRLFTKTIVLTDLTLATGAIRASMFRSGLEAPLRLHELSGLDLVLLLGVAVASWLALSSRLQLYHSHRTDSLLRECQLIAEIWIVTLGLSTLFSITLWRGLVFEPIVAFGLGFSAIGLQRIGIRMLLRRLRVSGLNFRRALLVGRNEHVPKLVECLQRNRHYGIQICGNVGFSDELGEPPRDVDDLGGVESLKECLVAHSVDYVLVCPSTDARAGEIQAVYEVCEEAGIQVHYMPGHTYPARTLPSVTWFGAVPAISFVPMRYNPARQVIKRGIDLLGATVGCVLLSPVMLACALAIKLHDRGPVFFRQRRVGLNGRIFTCYKFRTMRVGAERQREQLAALNERDGPVFKMREDPRVTPVGKHLRQYSLDELPQLFNVFKGEMSLVGPRPPTPDEVKRYDWWQRRRISVPPGLTCLWQISSRNDGSFRRWMEMDLYYIDNWSLWLDLKLIVQTMRVVVQGTGV